MPRLTHSVPKYRKHRASGQAVVTISGVDHYLGPHQSKTSHFEYDRLILEWIAAGRPSLSVSGKPSGEITIAELINAYRKHADAYYRKDGESTGTSELMRPILRMVRSLYGREVVSAFRPLSLEALQAKWLELGHCRKYINQNTARVKAMFRWGVSKDLVPVEVLQRLETVRGLAKGRTEAREAPPVLPVDDSTVDATLPALSPVVRSMVQFQRFTGARPSEVCIIRPMDLDRSGDVWLYRPESHKNKHRGKDRLVFIGPRAQEVLRPYLLRGSDAFCFSPIESERLRREALHAVRKTPLSCGNVPGSHRKSKPQKRAGARYTKDSYRRAVAVACDAAFPPPAPLTRLAGESVAHQYSRLSDAERSELRCWQSEHRWSPNQLRHTAGTEIRARFGLEAAQVSLGHSRCDTTQIYAERDHSKGVEVARAIG